MKKTLLTIVLVLAFAISVFYQHLSGSAANYAITSKANGAANSGATTSSGNIIYKDGEYTGNAADAYYGTVQVKAVVQNGKLSDVQFLSYPQDRNTSVNINTKAMTALKTEAVTAQSAKVDVVSGATDTTAAFKQSLSSALSQAI